MACYVQCNTFSMTQNLVLACLVLDRTRVLA